MKVYSVTLKAKRLWFFSRKFVVDVTTFSAQEAKIQAIYPVMQKGFDEKDISVISCKPTNAKVITKDVVPEGGRI